ncbi:hypothetical protein ACQP00_21560 [Dactylosporangium sp. CS-047395]|uniref:hypothetical protein n=1 Tax=Dactylosporangium sp. CS-047395 TaxID=3239936 RepID=UPI003D9432E0
MGIWLVDQDFALAMLHDAAPAVQSGCSCRWLPNVPLSAAQPDPPVRLATD